MPLTQISNQELEAIAILRQRLSHLNLGSEEKLKNDLWVVRYLRASGMNIDKTEKMLHYYEEYYREHDIENILTETFPKDFRAQFFSSLGGHDVEGRPLVAIPHCGLWNIRQAVEDGREEMFIRYVLQMGVKFEAEVLRRGVDYGYLIADVKNIAYGNFLHPRTLWVIINLVNLLEKLSPAVIRKVYLVNAPRILVTFFNTVRKFVKITGEIYVKDSNEEKWKAELREHFNEDGLCPEFGGTCDNFVLM